MEPNTNCINCGTSVHTRFCSQCGQEHPPKKLNFLTLYTDFQSKVYGFDGMFPRTIKELTLRPGKVSREYIDGNRTRYVGPVGYFFIMITTVLLLMELLNIDFYQLSHGSNPLLDYSPKNQEEMQKYYSNLMSKNLRSFSFALIPVTSVFAWLMFRKEKLNLLEHSIPVFYTSGHLLWPLILDLFIFRLTGKSTMMLQLILSFAFYPFACAGLYTSHSKIKAALKGLFVYVISYLVFFILIGTLLLVFMMRDPALRELLKPK